MITGDEPLSNYLKERRGEENPLNTAMTQLIYNSTRLILSNNGLFG